MTLGWVTTLELIYEYIYIYIYIYVVEDEKGEAFTASQSILARWRNHFSQLLNINWVNVVRQTEIHTAEPPVPEPSAFEVELATEKLKSHKSPGTDRTQQN